MLRKGQQYTVWSATSVASEDQLGRPGISIRRVSRRSTSSCPRTSRPRPPASPRRQPPPPRPVRQGDRGDAALAAVRDQGPTPPADRDWVDYTLFDVQTGYADSLATSMVVMLRTLGMPARRTGSRRGPVRRERGGVHRLRERGPRLGRGLFPRLGWINFEPSVLRDLPFRPPKRSRSSSRSPTACSPARARTCTWKTRTSTASASSSRLRRHGTDAVADRSGRRRDHSGDRGRLVRHDGAVGAAWRGCPGTPSGTATPGGWPASAGGTRRRRSSTRPGWSAATPAPARWSARSPRSTSRAPTAARSQGRGAGAGVKSLGHPATPARPPRLPAWRHRRPRPLRRAARRA